MSDKLRPTEWSEYVGQDRMKHQLQIEIDALLNKQEAGIHDMLPHIFLAGPPGYGKTTIASIIADKTGDNFLPITMPIKQDVFARMVERFEGGIIFLDELHAAPKAFQEDLLDFMQEGKLRRPNGKPVEHHAITIIAATTEPEKIIEPLRDRFQIKPRFEDYSGEQMGQIILGMADRVGVKLDADMADELGNATGGTPRIAGLLVSKLEALHWTNHEITVDLILDHCNIDRDGLTPDHHAYLKALDDLGGVAGTDKITNLLRLAPSLVRDCERLLKKQGLIDYTSQGRELLPAGINKIRPASTGSRRQYQAA